LIARASTCLHSCVLYMYIGVLDRSRSLPGDRRAGTRRNQGTWHCGSSKSEGHRRGRGTVVMTTMTMIGCCVYICVRRYVKHCLSAAPSGLPGYIQTRAALRGDMGCHGNWSPESQLSLCQRSELEDILLSSPWLLRSDILLYTHKNSVSQPVLI